MKDSYCPYLPPYFNDSTFVLHRKCKQAQCKLAYRLPSAAFLLKEARNFGKMLEGERDKKKKVYPRLPDMLGKKDTPYLYFRISSSIPLSSYVVRHSWASIAYQHNMDIGLIGKALGHTKTSTTFVYIKSLFDSNLASANQSLMQDIGI